MSQNLGRILGNAYKGATGALFGAALIAYAFRLYVQFRVLRRFEAEDRVFLLSVACLITCTVFNFINLGYTYDGLRLSLYGLEGTSLSEIIKNVPVQLKTDTVLLNLWWLTVCSVKLAYLLFFRKLVFRVQYLTKWWWIVTSFMVAVFVINVVLSSLTCPYSDINEIITKCSQASGKTRIPQIAISTTVLDIISDILIVSIPVALLWRVRLALRQKIGLATTLCLSTVMAIIGIIRIGALYLPGGVIDDVWASFWLQQECSIAVVMVSITASRALFVVSQHQQEERQESKSWVRYMFSIPSAISRLIRSLFQGRKDHAHPLGSDSLPAYDYSPEVHDEANMVTRSTDPRIPSATMTGARTAIGRVEGHDSETC